MRARESIERTLSSLPFFVTEEKTAKKNKDSEEERDIYMVKRKISFPNPSFVVN